MPEWLRGVSVAVAAVAFGLALALAGLWIAGWSPLEVASVWFTGSCDLRHLPATMKEAGPLLFAGLATAVAFRAGALNIGIEGQFLLGAIAYVGCATTLPPQPALPTIALALLLSALVGAGWAGIAAALERWRGVPLVLSTILLNFVAVFLVSWLVQGPLHDPVTTAPQTPSIPDPLRMPVLVAGTQLHAGVPLAFALAVIAWVVIAFTVRGFELTVLGANEAAARLVGIPAARRRVEVLLVSGAIAGVGGAIQQAGVTYYMSDSSVSYGYAGIAVALLGRLHPLGVALSAIFFGALDTGARGLERELGIRHDLGDVLKGVVVLSVLIGGALAVRRRAAEATA
jgi:simple sugar transport system permease protein